MPEEAKVNEGANPKPEEADSKEEKVKEAKPKEEKPKEEKPKEEKPQESKPAEEKPKETKPKEEKPKETKPKEEKPKEEKQTNCLACNKPIRKVKRYYRNGKFYCNKKCWQNFMKKVKEENEKK